MRRLSLPRRGLLFVAALALLLAAAGFFWLRDSSLVAVQQVTVTGASGPDAPRIEAALRTEAEHMTTLNVRGDELHRAVADFPTVAKLEVDSDLPHTVRIEVVERTPVAVVGQGDDRVPVTAAGRVLRGATADDRLPTLEVDGKAAGRVDDRRSRMALAVFGAAPPALLHRIERARFGAKGVSVTLRDGPEVIFGTADDLQAKWAAAARVLAEPSAAGAQYLDVRVPDRVAAGGLVDPSEATGPESAEEPGQSADPTAVTPQAPSATTTRAPAAPTLTTPPEPVTP